MRTFIPSDVPLYRANLVLTPSDWRAPLWFTTGYSSLLITPCDNPDGNEVKTAQPCRSIEVCLTFDAGDDWLRHRWIIIAKKSVALDPI